MVLGSRVFEPSQESRYVVVTSDRWLYRVEILSKSLRVAAKKERELKAPSEGQDQLDWKSRVRSSVNFGRPYDELAELSPPEQDDEGDEPRSVVNAAKAGDFLGVDLSGEDARVGWQWLAGPRGSGRWQWEATGRGQCAPLRRQWQCRPCQ